MNCWIFKKRKKGLMKKIRELSTLCGIDACAVVYSPYESMPEVWPDDRREAQRVISQFKRVPEMEQSKKMVNQESFIRGRIAKAADQLKKLHRDNREKEVTHLMYQCLTGKGLEGLTVPDLNDMGWLLDQNLDDIYKRIETLKKPPAAESSGIEKQPQQQPQWFPDWMGNPSYDQQHQMGGATAGGGGTTGDGMMLMQFNDSANSQYLSTWSNAFLS